MITNELIKINQKANTFDFLELAIFSYSFIDRELVIAASEDFSYFHNFEIRFKNVFSIIGNADWRVNTTKVLVTVVEDQMEMVHINKKYRVEFGNAIFKLNNEDGIDLYIIAEDILLVDKMVKY